MFATYAELNGLSYAHRNRILQSQLNILVEYT